MTAREIIVHGKVQGVFFRSSARDMAVILGLAGRVSNQPDGTVRLWLEGSEEAVSAMTEWCRTGPSRAEVNRVEVEESLPKGFSDFRVER
jgi:acylphosphatase